MTNAPESNAPTTKTAAARTEPMPVLPLRDVVVYPHMVIPLFVGREKSILALEQAMKVDKQVLLLAQRQADVDEPAAKDLYDVGTIATILQLLKLPDGTVKVLVEGVERASVSNLEPGDYFTAVAHRDQLFKARFGADICGKPIPAQTEQPEPPVVLEGEVEQLVLSDVAKESAKAEPKPKEVPDNFVLGWDCL